MDFFVRVEAWLCGKGLAWVCALHKLHKSIELFLQFVMSPGSAHLVGKKYYFYIFSLCICHSHSFLHVTLS
jgi:hypothetical protein